MDEERRKNGSGRRRTDDEPIHPWRWRMLALWILVFTLAVGWAIRSTRDGSAKVEALQHTNCGLVKFLLSARKTRWQTYVQKNNKIDLQAVAGYENLVEPFITTKAAIGHCPIPKRLRIQGRPLKFDKEGASALR